MRIAWLTPETLERGLGIAFDNCQRIRDGVERDFGGMIECGDGRRTGMKLVSFEINTALGKARRISAPIDGDETGRIADLTVLHHLYRNR